MYKRGSVVLVPFPFTDLTESKVRPAIIISNGVVDTHLIVAFTTSNAKNKSKYAISVDPSSVNGIKTGSLIVVSKITAIDPKIVIGVIGKLENTLLREVMKKVNSLFS